MDADFWHQKWSRNDIPFHESETNPLLLKYFDRLSLGSGSRVFLPLCGKTLDIHWLLSKGYRVVGAELSKVAVEQLFSELGVEPDIARLGELDHYRAMILDIFVGDLFHVTRDVLGEVHATYDRAALVALPETTRPHYAAHVTRITEGAPQLLVCFEYDQSCLEGPPFSISKEEVHLRYGDQYTPTNVARTEMPGGLKGLRAVKESVWILRK